MKPSFLIVPDEKGWLLACLADGQVTTRIASGGPADASEAVKALHEMGYGGGGVVLGLPSQMVMSAQIDCRDVPRKNRRRFMLHLLEEQLPLDMEDMTADFLPAHGGRTLGMAVKSSRARELVRSLSAEKIEPTAICPVAILALSEQRQKAEGADYCLVVGTGIVDVFRMEGSQPVAWYTVADDEKEITSCIQADLLSRPTAEAQTTACIIAPAQWSGEKVESELDLKIVNRENEQPLILAARAAGEIAGGKGEGWVNLRRDALASANPWGRVGRLLSSAAMLCLVLLATLAAAFLWRGMRYGDMAAQDRETLKAEYADMFPDRPVPPNPRKRLSSDLMLLTGGRGTGELPRRINALETLRRIAACLPKELRLRIIGMRIAPDEVFMEGQTLSHSDAEAISRGLSDGGFDMEPPQTESLASGGVSFTLVGKPAASSAESPDEGDSKAKEASP